MKELSIEQKAKAYDEAIERANSLLSGNELGNAWIYKLLPELGENEDENIRKALIEGFKVMKAGTYGECTFSNYNIPVTDIIAWLEKQGEQKPTDNEPKFHKGDWIVHHGTENIYQVVAVIDNQYQLKYGDNYTIQKCADVDRCARLWDITKDAKDGDILVDGNLPFIFKKIDANKYSYAYCGISVDDGFKIESEWESGEWTWMQDIKPATKEQRDTLMKAMADAGYTFDFKKKGLKKIEQMPAETVKWSQQEESCICQLESLVKEKWRQAEIVHNSEKIKKMSELMFFLKTLNPNKKPQSTISAEAKEAMYNKTAWSEEDEDNLTDIFVAIDNFHTTNHKKELITFLKSLKDRVQPQPKQEWNEEDKVMLDEIIDFFENGTVKLQHDLSLYASWLKSLRPLSTWKPTEQQMKVLNEVINFAADHGTMRWNDYIYNVLKSLREQIKNL